MGTQGRYVPAIDGLRAIAVLAVVAYHAGLPVSAGFVGVDVFFVISGYLITRILRDELAETGRISFPDFYARRARRILPALLAVVAVTVPAAWMALPAAESAAVVRSGMASLAFLANVHFAFQPGGYFDPTLESNPLLHLWSLGVEEQFYLAWPAVLLFARRRPAAALWTIAVGSFVVAEYLLATGQGHQAFFQTPARAWELAAGGLVAMHRPRVSAWVGHVGLATILAACFVPLSHFPGLGALPATIGGVAVVAAAANGHRLGALESRPMVWIGLGSYSLYLWHWPILVLGAASPTWLLVLASGLVAWASYRFVEQPLRKARVPNRSTLSGAVAAILALGCALSLLPKPAGGDPERTDEIAALLPIYRMGCDSWYNSAEIKPCEFGPPHADHTAVLIGDSVVMQWFPAVRAIFDRPGWRLVVLTKSSCPMVDAPFYYERIEAIYTQCSEWRASALRWITGAKPEIVITGSANNYGFAEGDLAAGLEKVLGTLSQASGQVVHLRSTPEMTVGGQRDYAEVAEIERRVADEFANVRQIDMNTAACPGACKRATFRDTRHLAPQFALSLVDELRGRAALQ